MGTHSPMSDTEGTSKPEKLLASLATPRRRHLKLSNPSSSVPDLLTPRHEHLQEEDITQRCTEDKQKGNGCSHIG
ncbi:unnamed protein product [Lactuca virosa]|uniref:Uncharacterized protein n=1 Tax=Lactuca virosa TaxID=75947 RepID=A0AAU9MEM6_9ASTR|nr:unnamed protein product [Lactuca virosa]